MKVSTAQGGRRFEEFILDQTTAVDPALQSKLVEIDAALRAKHGILPEQTSLGVFDLKGLRLAMVRPNLLMYGASVPKISILLAFFELTPKVTRRLPAQTRHELGMVIKKSDDQLATQYSKQLGLREIQRVLNSYGFYEAAAGGGIWMGKHYGDSSERIGDPVGNHSHAVTVLQLLRFYLLLEQGKLVSREASLRMREIFALRGIPHDPIKFVKGLEGREVEILRKWGSWEDWLHDSAVIRGKGRHYVLVGLTHHAKGDEYLVELAAMVDQLLGALF